MRADYQGPRWCNKGCVAADQNPGEIKSFHSDKLQDPHARWVRALTPSRACVRLGSAATSSNGCVEPSQKMAHLAHHHPGRSKAKAMANPRSAVSSHARLDDELKGSAFAVVD